MINYVHPGKSLTVLSAGAVASSAPVLIGHLFGVAKYSVTAASQPLEVLTEGVFDIPKDTSTFAAGDKVYFASGSGQATSTATSNVQIGIAEAINPDGTAALGGASGDATVRVKLLGFAI